MKKYLYSIVFATLILVSTTVVKAANEVYYTNKENIEMTEEEYNNLLGLGFTEKQIYRMDEQEFLNNKDIEGTVLSVSEKYFRNYTILRNGITTYRSEEISEEEAIRDRELQAEKIQYRSGPSGNYYDGVVATTTIQVKAKIIGIASTRMRLMTDVDWYTMPSNRYNDIIAAGFESSKVQFASTIVFREDWRDNNGNDGYNTVCSPKSETNGGSAIFQLPSGSLSQLESYLYFNVKKASGVGTITALYTSGDYAHGTSYVSQSNLINHYTVTSAVGISMDSTYGSYYQQNTAAQAAFIGTW